MMIIFLILSIIPLVIIMFKQIAKAKKDLAEIKDVNSKKNNGNTK